MNNGEKAILVPGTSKAKKSKVAKNNIRLAETLRAMTEEVTVLSSITSNGNAKVMDKYGKVFLCNPNDLSPVNEDLYNING